jgi:PAS domain S-box-containing protein
VLLETSGVPIIDDKGCFVGYRGIDRDATERKKTENALEESEKRYRMIAENMQDLIMVIDSKGVYTYVSPSMESVLGYSLDDLRGKNAFDMIYPEDADFIIKKIMPKLLRGEENALLEFRFRTKAGAYLWLEASAKAIKETTEETKILVVSRNIEERKKAQDALFRSETRLRSLYESAFDGILIANFNGRILSANPAACHMFGMTEKELINVTRKDIIVTMERLHASIEDYERTGKAVVALTFCRKDGSTFEG